MTIRQLSNHLPLCGAVNHSVQSQIACVLSLYKTEVIIWLAEGDSSYGAVYADTQGRGVYT